MAIVRESNMELCRVIAILCVMLIHTTFQSLGNDVSLGVMILASFSIVGVNVFVMLTGYFSATPKKSSLINLVFICFFWMIIKVICRYRFGEELGYEYAFFVTSSNWFIPSYIGLLFFAPILNSFCNSVSKKKLWGGGIALLFIEIWFDWLMPHPRLSLGTQYGYSVLSFLVLYLLARAIHLYGLPSWFKKAASLVYLSCSVSLVFGAMALIRMGYERNVGWWFSYTNPIIVLSSMAFMVSFERLSFQSTFVNHIAKSTLAVLLGHSAIFFLYTKQFKYLFQHFSGIQIVGYWVLAIIIVFIASILIDQLRLLLWKPINNWVKTHIKQDIII